MSRRSHGFSKRFPNFGLFLVIALAIAIPLTVWSLKNASTNIEQFAQAPKCGPNNQNPSCPSDFKCSYTAGNPILGGNCALKTLKPVKNLKSNSTCEYNSDGPNNTEFTLTWDRVQNANSYKIYGNYYYIDQGSLTNVRVGPYSATNNSGIIDIPIPQNVKFFYWYVRAYNTSFKVIGPMGSGTSLILNCH
jgi:hypothetical protein